jgi:hypothetical protein
MIRKLVVAAVAASLLGAATLGVAAESNNQQAAPVPAQAVSLNPMNPAVVSGFMNPQSHQMYHQALMNPASWTQFAQPNFYMQMANPAMMMQWMNPASYQVMMDPNTYMYWMQPNVMMGEMTGFMNPASYQAMMNPASYYAFMNPGTYMTWMNPAAYTVAAQQMAAAPAAGYNWFDMNAWTNYFQPPVNQPKAEAQGE